MQLSDVLKLPEKTWTQKGNGVNATINTVGQAKQGQYNWKQPVNITDMTGVPMDITFETEYPESLLNQGHIGKRAIWRLKWWRGHRGTSISGYVENQLNEAGQPEMWQLPPASQAPQNPQQGTQQPAQATKAPQRQDNTPDWDAIAEGKVRHGILCAMLQGGVQVDYEEVLRHTVFVMTGIDPNTAPNPHPDIQVQRCNQCGAEDVTQCSCTPW